MSKPRFVKSQHYYVRLAEPLPAAKWFSTTNAMKHWAAEYGYEVDEFGDCHEVDRADVRRRGESDEFEGLLVQMQPNAKIDLAAFFSSEGLMIRRCEID